MYVKKKTLSCFQKPIVMSNSDLAAPATRWTMDYLEEHIGSGDYSVYESDSHLFKYFDEKKVPGHKDFRLPMRRKEMKFSDFVERLNQKSSKK